MMKTAARNTLTTASDIFFFKIHCTLQSLWYSYIDIVNHE